jgi:hypothetical protein
LNSYGQKLTGLTMNIRQKIGIAVLDVLVLIELGISIYRANMTPDLFTLIFVKTFFVLVIPTLVVARIVIKRLRTVESSPSL